MRSGRVEHGRRLRRAYGTVACGMAVLAVLLLAACSDSSEDAGRTVAGPTSTERVESSRSRILEEQTFVCTGRVDLDLVRVTMRKRVNEAISLGQNCTGRIGRIEVETWTGDGVKVQNSGRVAHDFVIESGYIKCHDILGEYHQDGIQVMGGRRITFRGLRVDCLGNSNLFVAEGGLQASTPTEVVCEGCVLGPNSGQTLFYGGSIRSGARDTTICTGRFRAIRVEPGARRLVDEGNEVLAHGDPSCEDVTGREVSR